MNERTYSDREIKDLFNGVSESLKRIEARLDKKEDDFERWKENNISLTNMVSRHSGDILKLNQEKEDKLATNQLSIRIETVERNSNDRYTINKDKINDHENRIRKIETRVWMAIGALAVVQIGITLFTNFNIKIN
jgi:hypothetical protein